MTNHSQYHLQVWLEFFMLKLFRILGRALCGINFIPHYDKKLPDCAVFKCIRGGNFLKSCSTLFSVEEFTRHIKKHVKKNLGSTISIKGITDHQTWQIKDWYLISDCTRKQSLEILLDKTAITVACRCLPHSFFANEARDINSKKEILFDFSKT